MNFLHGFAVVGAIAVLLGSIWQAATEYSTRTRIIKDHVSYEALQKQALQPIPFWARRRRREAVENLQKAAVWTDEDQREYRRAMRSMQAWGLIIVGALYAVIATLFAALPLPGALKHAGHD